MLISTLIISAFGLQTEAQNRIIIPKKNAKAFDAQTRQKNGNPGEKYW